MTGGDLLVWGVGPLLSYLLGGVPFGLLAGKLLKGIDLREHGSGNIGATNAVRVLGKSVGIPVFVLDVLKGLAPALVFSKLLASAGGAGEPEPVLRVLYGACAILGHTAPVYLRFKGGKAVATSAGVFLALAWLPTLIAFASWVILFLTTRYVSVASITAAVVLPVSLVILRRGELGEDPWLFTFAFLIGALVIVRHRSNLRRLLAGTENRFSPAAKDPEPEADEAQ